MSITRIDYARAVKAGLGIPNDILHIGATRALVAWMGAESGWYAPCDGQHGAASNPLNSTLTLPGCTAATPYNTIPVQNYSTIACGIDATVQTLEESRYVAIVTAMRKTYCSAEAILMTVGESEWGTDSATLMAVLSTYQHDRSYFNLQVITGAPT